MKDPNPKPRVTSQDVARSAGVSRATVSYVLNDAPNRRVSEATRRLVLRHAERLSYVPHASARALRRGRSNVILGLVSDFNIGYVRDEVVGALDRELTRRGYVLLIHRHDPDRDSLSDLWSLISPDVVVAMSGLPASAIDTVASAQAELIEVQELFAQHTAGEMQVDYLYKVGHQRLGYGFTNHSGIRTIAEERLAGAVARACQLGLPTIRVENVDRSDPPSFERAIDRWLGGADPVTAVAMHNDELAAMAMMALANAGRSTDDLAVIGVDDVPFASMGITTVAVDLTIVTENIVELVVAALEGRDPEIDDARPLQLIPRQSA